jgi:hypothetical protein
VAALLFRLALTQSIWGGVSPGVAFHGQFLVDGNKHKKARRAFAVRAFRTSYQALVTINQEFWWAGGV